MPAVHERERDGRREGGLADAAFAHRHHDPVAGGVELIHKLAKRRQIDRVGVIIVGRGTGVISGELPQRAKAGDVACNEPHSGRGERGELLGSAGGRGSLPCRERGRRGREAESQVWRSYKQSFL